MRQHPVKPKTTRKKTDAASRSSVSNYHREDEGSDDEGAISLNAIKNKYKGGAPTTPKGKNNIIMNDFGICYVKYHYKFDITIVSLHNVLVIIKQRNYLE